MSSPRATGTARLREVAASAMTRAEALLLTTIAASAPVSLHKSRSTYEPRRLRSPVARSISRLLYPDAASLARAMARGDHGARPRLV